MNLTKEQLEILIAVMTDKIKDLELANTVLNYDIRDLKEENAALKAKLEEKEF